MLKKKIGELFHFISETNLTEKDFYDNKGEYPVYGGKTELMGIVSYIDSYNQDEPCVTFTTYGSAGKINYRKGQFTIGRNCMGLRLNEEYIDKLLLEWFAYKFQNLFYRLRIGDPNGQMSLNRLLIQEIEIEIPDKKIQEKQLLLYKKVFNIRKKIEKIKNELKYFLESKHTYETKFEDKIDNIFDIMGGNGGLTEKFIYYNQPTNKDEEILIFSSATKDSNLMGSVSKFSKPEGKKLKIFKAPCVLITRNGYAGRMTFVSKGIFTTNDHAYVIKTKDEWKDKVNLRWFAYQYQELFYNIVTSKNNNATFSKEYAEKQIIKLPDKNIQDDIAKKLIRIDFLITKFNNFEMQLRELSGYEIIS